MSPKLRPLRLPLLVEERRRKEEEEAAQHEAEIDVPYNFYTTDSYSSDAASPVTPTFSARGHLRYSSSMSSFDLATVASSDSPSSPTQTAQSSGKRVLPDVEEEPIEYEDSDSDLDDASELYHCLCDDPCIHRDTDLVQSTSNFYRQNRSTDYDVGFFSDGDFSFSMRSSRKRRDGSESSFAGFTQRIGSRFPSFTKWKSSKPSTSSIVSSPMSDYAFDQRPILSRATSSRSSSLSAPSRRHVDRSTEAPVPSTPALSRFGSNDSFMPFDGTVDIKKANDMGSYIEHERKQAVTPLLPPMMASTSTEQILPQPSPLESPSVASPGSLYGEENYSTGMISPPLSARPSASSLRLLPPVELPQLPAPDAWSDRLGHANYTIVPRPYKPETADLESLRLFRADWETARVNYTKHLARTGEHYGQTSKTYALTEAKWAETQRTWRNLHDEIAEAVVASGEVTVCEKFDEGVCVLTTVPRMDAEGKFPERGDEDIVGPMVREATMMSLDNVDRKGPSFWRNLAGKVRLRK